MSAQVRARKTWRRRLAWTVLALVLLGLVGIAVPWSPGHLKRLTERLLAQRLNCNVEVERVTLWPLLRQLRVRNVKLDYSSRTEHSDIADFTASIWKLGDAVVHVHPSQLISRRQPLDLTVVLRNADPVVVGVEEGSLAFFPPFGDLAERRSTSTVAGRWRLSSVLLENGCVRVMRPASAGASDESLRFSNLRLDYENNPESESQRLSVWGDIGSKGESPFRAQMVRRRDLWALRLRSEVIRFGQTGSGPVPLRGTAEEVHVHGRAERDPAGDWDFRLLAASPRVEVSGVVEERTSMTMHGHFDEHTSQGAISLEASSPASRFHALLDLALDGSRDSQTTVSVERLADGWFQLWNEHRPPESPMIQGHQGNLLVTAAARLSRQPPWMDLPRARVLLRDVQLDSEYLPLTIHDVDLEGTVSPDRIELQRCRGRWARGWVSLHGTHEGQWWPQREGTTRFEWAFALRAEDLTTTLPAAAESTLTTAALAALEYAPLLEGDLAGTGTLILDWEQPQQPGRPTTKTLQGLVTLRHGRIVHPALPKPVTDIDGTFEISPQRLQIRPVQGRLLGTTATISGAVEGEPFFWVKPTARCSIQTKTAIADAIRFAPEEFQPRIEATKPHGNLALSVALAGPLRRPFQAEDIAATGTILFRDLGFESPFWALDGTFRDIQGQANLTQGIFRLTTATGWIEDVPFSLQAEAAPQDDRFSAKLESSATLAALQQVVPRALSRYEVSGGLSGSYELEAWGPDLFRQASHIRELTSETLANLPFQWELRGEVMAHDAQLTFETYPTSLTAINGRTTLRNLEWTFEDLTSSWGKTDNCRISGSGRFRPGSWPVMHLELEAPVLYLDEWIRPWRRSGPRRFPPHVPNPVFEMTGVIRGRRAFYRGHPGENFSGEFDLVSPYRSTRTFRFFNTHADLYGGRLSGQGRIEFFRGNSTNTLELVAQDISLPPFLQCESGREQTFIGRLSGDGSFHWHNGDADSLTGRGRILISESKFWGNVFFRRLGQLLKIPILDDVSFASIEVPWHLRQRRVTCERLDMEGPLIAMRGQGTVGFDHSVDFVLELGFRRLPEYARLLDLIVQYFGKLPASVFSLDLRGTWDDPQFSFHHLGVAEQGLLDAIGQLWDAVAPTPPKSQPRPTPNEP
ncbi:hypothetical protein AMJ85_05190 [candidate division BRC1 bacterium SM23_51]|nr:MAG: hypothetical protein AMJ85_05190 [candidate division BRC1 bacterium SM23_51]